jgi:hypothetical protein
MAEHQLPKLTVRVRFPSSAPENSPWSDTIFRERSGSTAINWSSVGPSTGPHGVRGRPRFALREPGVEGCRDRLVGHSAAVLIDQGSGG